MFRFESMCASRVGVSVPTSTGHHASPNFTTPSESLLRCTASLPQPTFGDQPGKGEARIMKRMLSVATAIGFLISTIFMAIPSMRDGTNDWASLELAGMAAAYLFWGAAGDSVFVGTVIGWAVNAVIYGLAALAILGALKIISAAARKISN
jgi:hypothetical protein